MMESLTISDFIKREEDTDVDVAQKQRDKAKKKRKSKSKEEKKTREPKLSKKYKQSINPSKRHRDRLNGELDNLAKLLPFPEDVIARLDKLSILRLSVSYLRNKNFFKGSLKSTLNDIKHESTINRDSQFAHLFNEAIDGFVLVVTINGEIFYVSEGVKDFLGYSQSQVLHQPLETLVHDDDRDELSTHLKGNDEAKVIELTEGNSLDDLDEVSDSQREFVIRLKSVLNTSSSDMYKPFKIAGTIRKLNIEPDVENLKYALFAFCTPARTTCSMLEIRMKSMLFCSKNRIDLSFLDMDARGKEFFGYSKKDLFGRSSYVLVHRQDLQHLRCKHSEIITCGKSSVGTFRLMNKSSDWAWVCGYARVLYKNGKPDFLVTTNRIMSEDEGQAMLKIRDDADFKALGALGLIEPEDAAKALELGFPSRTDSALKAYGDALANNEPIPMPLSSFLSLDSMPPFMDPVVKTQHMDLLKEPIFDVDVPDVLLEQSNQMFTQCNNTQSYPMCDLSPETFQSNKSSHSAGSSDITNYTHTSMRSGGSVHSQHNSTKNTVHRKPKLEQQPFQANLSPNGTNQTTSYHAQSKPPMELSGSPSSTNKSLLNIHPSPDTSLFEGISNLNLLHQHHVIGQSPPIKYPPYSVNQSTQSFTSNDNNYYRNQQHQQQRSTYNQNYSRAAQYSLHNPRSLYEQSGPVVTVSTPEYELDSIRAQLAFNGHSNPVDMQRQFNFTPFMNAVSQPSNWMRPPNLSPSSQQTVYTNLGSDNTVDNPFNITQQEQQQQQQYTQQSQYHWI